MRQRLENLICEMLDGKILLSEALTEFEKDLKQHPNRHNGLIGQAMAKEKAKK